MTVEKNKSQEPYVPGSGPLLWYSKPGDDTICVWYLRALLQGTVEVPHWQASGFYQALVEGRPVSKRSRCSKASLAIKNVDPDEWDVPLPLPMPKAKAKRAAKKRKLMLPAPNLNDREAVDNIAVIEEPERQALADDAETANSDDFEDELLAELEAVSSPSLSPPATPKSAEDGRAASSAAQAGAGVSSTSSSSSSSSSSSAASSCSSGPAPSAKPSAKGKATAKAKGKANAKAKGKQPRRTNPKGSFRYGMGHFVRVYKDGEPQGWEMSCGHPAHNDMKCRKHLKDVTRNRTSEQTLQLLKIWLIRGRHALSAKEHLTEIWSEAERDFKLGQLEYAPEVPPLNYTDADGQQRMYIIPANQPRD